MQYIDFCFLPAVKIENSSEIIVSFLIFAQNMDCGYMLEPPHFFLKQKKKKKKKKSIPFHTIVLLHKKVGYKGVCITWKCYPNGFFLITES